RATVVRAIVRHAPPHRPLEILDAGCGTGGLLTELAALGRASGPDLSPHAGRYAPERGPRPLLRGAGPRLPFRAQSFDVVVAPDVLYHRAVPDDVAALRELARLVRPDGLVILNLAAHEWLKSHHDRVVHTARRYSRRTMRALVQGSGLELVHLTY